MDDYLLLISTFIAVGMLEIILGLPLLFEKVKPNWLYGFRLPSTLSNEEIWYKSNKYVGRDFVVSGIILTFMSLVLLLFRSGILVVEIAIIFVSLLTILTIIIVIRARIYLKKLKN